MTDPDAARPELWGGLTCSMMHVGDVYRDPFEEIHARRRVDLDHVAAIGIKTLRYPVH